MTPLLLSPISRSVRYSFLAVIVLGTIIRLVGITTPLHGDELATISIWANMPLLSIPTHYEYPNNHILHTLVVATIFKIFGLNPFLLRTPVLVCGIASIAFAFLTTHRITRNAQAGLAVSLLIAINGGHIFYSTHARGYMLILLICQYIFHRLVVWIDESKISSRSIKEESTDILLPMELFASERRIGNFTFRKVNPQFVYNSYTLRSPKDWKRWGGMIHSTPVILEPPSMHSGELPALKIKEPGTLIAYSEDEISDAVFSININLVAADREIGRKVSYLHAVEEDGQYVSKSAWLANEWVLDHPYGPDILNQHWQTKIFITEGKQPVEIIRIPEIEQGQFGHLRGIQSYRLVISKHTSKTNGDKL